MQEWVHRLQHSLHDNTMPTLLLGLLLFLGAHSLQALFPNWRAQWRSRWGEMTYKGLYSLLSLAGLVLVVLGYSQARAEPVLLWTPPQALLHISWLLMWLSMVLLVAAYWPGNRIRQRLGHPMTLGVKVWALGHLLANGNLADVLLFGSFLVWAVLVFRSARRRPAPVGAVAKGSALATVLTVLVGTGLWALFLWGGLHARWIGVNPLGSAGA